MARAKFVKGEEVNELFFIFYVPMLREYTQVRKT